MPEKIIGTVIIRGERHQLIDIPGKEHNLGKMNNCPTTLWIKKEKDLFNDEVEYIPWIDKGTNRQSWNISIKQGNSIKFKYDEYYIQGFTNVVISLNNVEVYEFISYKLEYAFNQAQDKIYRLENLPIVLDDLKKDEGREIYYKSLPCKIGSRFSDGTMMINPDCKEGELEDWWNQFTEPWYNDNMHESMEEWKDFGEVKVDILSEQIYWWRNDRETKLNKLKRYIKKGT